MKRALSYALVIGMALCIVSPLAAQSRRFRGENYQRPDYDEFNVQYDGRFTFVRIRYTPLSDSWGRPGDLKWDHDYPRAERHLVKILDEITDVSPVLSGSNILSLDDPELFKYPVAYLSEPGYWTLSEEETEGLRNYLLKGGFLILDDFVGSQWYNFEAMMREVLPDSRLVELDVSHPVFHSFFDIDALDHIHPYYRGYISAFYGIFEDNDPNKRLLVIANYNNDIGESWEWSDTGFLPIELSNEAYKLGVNYIVYAMTH
jgi:hypothetical protein